jgi:hypothetical protein
VLFQAFHAGHIPVPKPNAVRKHVDGCFHSDNPTIIVQDRGGGVSKDLYFKHCDGIFKNIQNEKMELGSDETSASSKD